MVDHTFGGEWTEDKLRALGRYLSAYRVIFTRNQKARYFKTIYVDAFAGTGTRKERPAEVDERQSELFDQDEEIEIGGFKDGSARIALSLESPFDKYIFVDKNPEHIAELDAMIAEDFPQLKPRCHVWQADCCDVMAELCRYRDWQKERAVVFLDPYGMNVEWALIERIAATKAIDLWLLFPLGMGVNRLLTRDGTPNPIFASKLTRMFGTDKWQDHFYRTEALPADLFAEQRTITRKEATFEGIGRFYLERLATVFAGVCPQFKLLYNTRGNPLYMLCFAASNPIGAKPAIDIAHYLMGK